jgi:hypothetical protein
MFGAGADADLTKILGPRCPDCGWRSGQHRPQAASFDACPQWVPPAGDDAAPPAP